MTVTLHTAEMEENITSKVEDLVDDSNDKTSKKIDPYVDVLGNGQIKKKVLKKGKDDTRPNRGDICTINIVGTLDDGTVAERYNDLTIQIGDMEVVQGLDLTIVLMDLGEIAEIIIHPRFAYGACGNDPIPPNATIMYTVELKAIEPQPEIENMSINQRREISNKKRERGNWWFIRKDAICAVQCYRRALEYLTPNTATSWNEKVEVETTDAELQALLDDRIKVYNNLAAALMEKGSFYEALDHLEQVLKYQPTNVKALYRKAKIYKIRKEYSKAYMTFLEAQKLQPDLKALQGELISLRDKISKDCKREKHLYRKMLGMVEESDKSEIEDIKIEDKKKISKGILWTLVGASAAIIGILVHRFAS